MTEFHVGDRVRLLSCEGSAPGKVVALGPRGKVQVIFDDMPNRWVLKTSSLERVTFNERPEKGEGLCL